MFRIVWNSERRPGFPGEPQASNCQNIQQPRHGFAALSQMRHSEDTASESLVNRLSYGLAADGWGGGGSGLG
ncbi:MAG: hypothetical protein WA713_20305, partial [Candidatus Acidiferrales bacterium]